MVNIYNTEQNQIKQTVHIQETRKRRAHNHCINTHQAQHTTKQTTNRQRTKKKKITQHNIVEETNPYS